MINNSTPAPKNTDLLTFQLQEVLSGTLELPASLALLSGGGLVLS